MLNPTLSVVVPIYNAAEFLEECLMSVRDQLKSDCEVILVNDGSTDDSLDVIKERFADELGQASFIVVEISNSGPGEARNAGVRVARGRYVGFLDSDDLMLPGYFDAVLKEINDASPQIIQFHLTRFSGRATGGQELIKCHRSEPGSYALSNVRNDIFGVGKWFPSCRVYRRELLLAHPFPRNRVFYEDLVTLPFMFLEERSITLLNTPLIAYRDNPTGTTRRHTPEDAETLFAFYARLSVMPSCAATDMLRVQVARSIVFFTMELQLSGTSVRRILAEICEIDDRALLLRHLGRGDALFLRFPKAYSFAEWARQRMQRGWRR